MCPPGNVSKGGRLVGAAGWILEKFGKWADLPTTADGSPDNWNKFSEEQLLTNIMLYLAPSSVVTATWIYHGKRLEGSQTFPAGTRIRVPAGVAAFPDAVFLPPPRSFAEKTYNIVHWSEMSSGGHFILNCQRPSSTNSVNCLQTGIKPITSFLAVLLER